MDSIKNKQIVGFFLKHNDIDRITVVNLHKELNSFLFEINIMKLAVNSFLKKNVFELDCLVGDWKCQTRASMVVDMIQCNNKSNELFFSEELQIDQSILQIEDIIYRLNSLNSIELQQFTKFQKSLFLVLKEYNVNYVPSESLSFLSLCFSLTVCNDALVVNIKNKLSRHRFKAFMNSAKSELCRRSIDYEQSLGLLYGSAEEQKALNQVEIKNVQHMTALYPSFKVIFSKMKHLGQPFIVNRTIFCGCGGIQKVELDFFAPVDGVFVQTKLPEDVSMVVTAMDVYQFPGSLEQLQNILGVATHEINIPKEFCLPCQCNQPTVQQSFDSFQEAIMAFFAQHPQFTNGNEIDWQGLELLDSDLKKEYDYLLTLKGYSRNDMSKLQIIHMYPSTVQHLLEEQEVIRQQLKKS